MPYNGKKIEDGLSQEKLGLLRDQYLDLLYRHCYVISYTRSKKFLRLFMKYSYPYRFDVFANVVSVFDIGATIPQNNISLAKGLDFDLQQLSKDQDELTADLKKASDRIRNETFGDKLE